MHQLNISGLVLRAMTPADLPSVLAIEHASYFTPWTKNLFVESLQSPQHICQVLLVGEEVVAYVVVANIIDEADLLNVAVSEPWRQQGLARYLIEQQKSTLKDQGMARFFLEVNVSNTAAIHLYEQLGFCVVGRRKGYYPSAVGLQDALVMCHEFSA